MSAFTDRVVAELQPAKRYRAVGKVQDNGFDQSESRFGMLKGLYFSPVTIKETAG